MESSHKRPMIRLTLVFTLVLSTNNDNLNTWNKNNTINTKTSFESFTSILCKFKYPSMIAVTWSNYYSF